MSYKFTLAVKVTLNLSIRPIEVVRETGRDGCQVHCGTVLGDAFSTWWQICVPKQSHNAL